MKLLLFLLLLSNNVLSVFCQKCSKENLTYLFIKESLVSDIYFYLDFKKEDVPEAKIFCNQESIRVNNKRFNIIDTSRRINYKKVILNFSGIGYQKDSSNYILFHSELENNVIMCDVLFNRPEFFNVTRTGSYDVWCRMNSGVSYIFTFDENGCLLKIDKKPISFD